MKIIIKSCSIKLKIILQQNKHQDSINENIDVETSSEINGSQPELENRKDIGDGLILVPSNQKFLLNILEKEEENKNEIAPRKNEVRN